MGATPVGQLQAGGWAVWPSGRLPVHHSSRAAPGWRLGLWPSGRLGPGSIFRYPMVTFWGIFAVRELFVGIRGCHFGVFLGRGNIFRNPRVSLVGVFLGRGGICRYPRVSFLGVFFGSGTYFSVPEGVIFGCIFGVGEVFFGTRG